MAKATKTKPAKYTDKSSGQPELVSLYSAIKKLITPYSKNNYSIKADKPGHYELYFEKEIEHLGRKHAEISFAGLLIQKGYVGFYFFPIYTELSLKNKLNPELLKTLKGKTCFHIKKEDPVLLQQIKEALEIGYEYYTSKGWR